MGRRNYMQTVRGTIFDIKHFAVHDGPGVRTTVFLKGCPLECWWCHNPEGISTHNEIVFYDQKCIECNKCVETCKQNAVKATKQGIKTVWENCIACGECVKECPTGARQRVGRELTVKALMEKIKKQVIYYDTSGGGVTFSGGEPLMQPTFLKKVLKRCKEEKIHITLDTSGYASPALFQSFIDYVDLFLYDIKLLDESQHQKYTGVSNHLIKRNLEALVEEGRGEDVILRFPVVPGITDTTENLQKLAQFVSSLQSVREIDLLPFHNVAEKYKRLGKKHKMEGCSSISQVKVRNIKEEKLEVLKGKLRVKIMG